MHAFKTIFTIAASVAMVAAMPTNEKPNPDAQDKCNNNQVAACCDPSDFILGLNCVVDILNSCGGAQQSCCQATQSGLINLLGPCTVIDI